MDNRLGAVIEREHEKKRAKMEYIFAALDNGWYDGEAGYKPSHDVGRIYVYENGTIFNDMELHLMEERGEKTPPTRNEIISNLKNLLK